MNPDFWINRWATHDTPWHQAQPEQLLVRNIQKGPHKNILVPLCGKSIDLLWLRDQGHKVIGVELSSIACRAFFEESKIDFKLISAPPFEIFESADIKIYCGDFFKLTEPHLPLLDMIYDRAALIALPLDLRMLYAAKISKLILAKSAENFEMLVITREDPDANDDGPPFNISEENVRALYGENFFIETLERISRPSRANPATIMVETAFKLIPRVKGF